MSKLTDHKILEGKLVTATKDRSYRHVPGPDGGDRFEPTRFHHVIDEMDEVIASGRTDQFTLVQNRDLVSALDLAAEGAGIVLTPRSALYHNGQARYEFTPEGMEFTAPGDTSPTMGRIILGNDYRGQGGLSVSSGWFRLVCTNGLTVGTVAHKDTLRHVGEIDLMRFVTEAVTKFQRRYEVEKVLAERLAGVPVENLYVPTTREDAQQRAEDDPIAAIYADTAERYHLDLTRTISSNLHDAGRSHWGLAQAVSEIATHRMQTTATGERRTRPNLGADAWATRQLNRIIQNAEGILETTLR